MLNNDTWDLGMTEIIILTIMVLLLVFSLWFFSKLLKRK